MGQILSWFELSQISDTAIPGFLLTHLYISYSRFTFLRCFSTIVTVRDLLKKNERMLILEKYSIYIEVPMQYMGA